MANFSIFGLLILFACCLLHSFEFPGVHAGGDNGVLSPKEKVALSKFKKMVTDLTYKDYMKWDTYLVRWLRARDLDLEAAHKMFKAAVKWRIENRIDGILNETTLEFTSTPYYKDGLDYDGDRIVTMLVARLDTRKYLLAGKRVETIRWADQLYEILETDVINLAKSRGYTANSSRNLGGTCILDLTGYNLRQHACLACLQVYVEWIQHMESYYPEGVKHLILINVPRIAIPLIEFLKPIMSPSTRKALQVYGPNRNEWLPVVKRLIPLDQIRSNFGGTKHE